jgi:hypothetical protein
MGRPEVKHRALTLTIIAMGVVICISTGAIDSAQAGHHSRGHIAASLIAEDLVTCYPELESAECFLVSQVGQPIDRPQLINVRLTLRTLATAPSRSEVERTITRHLAGLRTLADDQLAGTLVIGRWPLRSS